MTRIVVVGGSGFLGSRAVRALERAPGVEVVSAGRRGPLVVDLSRPETFASLEGADVVVDVSSSHAVAPDALARFCLARGLTLLEASSDRVIVERLLDAHRADRTSPGALVLGAGIFTGLSNAMAGEVARLLPGATAIELGVSSSPFSGAGGGTVDLMADVLAIPTRAIRAGARVDDPPVSPGPVLPFPRGPRATIQVPFAEPVMVHASTGAPAVAMYMAPRPALLRLAFLALPIRLLRSAPFGAFMRLYFRLVRRVLLGTRASPVELVARARAGTGEAVVTLHVEDGMEAGGVAIAATALALGRAIGERTKGTHLVDEVVPFERMVAEMRALAPDLALGISRSSGR